MLESFLPYYLVELGCSALDVARGRLLSGADLDSTSYSNSSANARHHLLKKCPTDINTTFSTWNMFMKGDRIATDSWEHTCSINIVAYSSNVIHRGVLRLDTLLWFSGGQFLIHIHSPDR